ncbi:MAG: twin-arginine translocation signal domain-containing protein [Haloarculaceae archaeon]
MRHTLPRRPPLGGGTVTPDAPTRRAFLRAAAAVGGGATVGCLGNGGPDPATQVENKRDALSKYEDVKATLGEGYQTTAKYVRTDGGALGEVFVNFDAPSLDPTTPNAVLYTLTEDGVYEPLGCKWFVPAEEADSPPSLFGKEFRGPIESDVPFVPKHYALHVWVYRDNPEGLFARYNPAVEPPSFVDDVERARDAIGKYQTGAKAQEAGYANTEKCAPGDGGAYGVPFVREGAVDSGGTDLGNPPVLLYRVTENWSYVLLGAEWYVPAEEADEPPTMFGQRFHDPAPAHSAKVDQPKHYGLHAWLFRANPAGMFAPYNPAFTC